MEKSALAYQGLPEDEAVEALAGLKETCRRFGGDFVLLWHNDWVVGRRARRLYERVLAA
jgi:hypothetical protein